MSLLSSALSVGKKVASKVYSTVNAIGNSLALKQPAAASMASWPQSNIPVASSLTGGQQARVQQDLTTLGKSTGAPRSGATASFSLPGDTLTATPGIPVNQPRPIAASTSKNNSGSSVARVPSAPTSLTTQQTLGSFSGGGTSLASASLGSGGTGGGTGGFATGGTSSGGTATSSAQTQPTFYDPVTGQAVTSPDQTQIGGVQGLESLLKKYMPEKESVLKNPEIVKAQNEYDQARSRANTLNNQITEINNRATAQVLSTQGQGRGIPEAIIGGQQAEIYKEAAIQSLPIQSQLAYAQGDVQSAQEHLTRLSTLLTEEVNNKFEYAKSISSAVIGYATDVQKAQIQSLLGQRKDFGSAQSQVYQMLAQNNAPPTVWEAVRKAANTDQLYQAAGQYGTDMLDTRLKEAQIANAEKGGGSGLTPYQSLSYQNQIEDNFRTNPAVQNYTNLVNFGVPSVVSEIAADPNSVKDTILMRTLAKITDPSTGVREGEYETFQNSIGAINRLFVMPGSWIGAGRLTQEGREQMTKLVLNRFNAAQSEYKNQYDYYSNQAKAGGVGLPPAYQASAAPAATPPTAPAAQESKGWWDSTMQWLYQLGSD